MNNEKITDMDLMEFCKWYVGFHGTKPVAASVLTTCLCGYFATFSKEADKLLARLKKLDLITMTDNDRFLISC